MSDDTYARAHIGQDTVMVERTDLRDPDGERRTTYRWEIHTADGDAAGADLRTGVDLDRGANAMLATLLSFLGAAAESYDYGMRTGEQGENSDLFPPHIVEWAYLNSDELATVQYAIEEEDQS